LRRIGKERKGKEMTEQGGTEWDRQVLNTALGLGRPGGTTDLIERIMLEML
jgi:hypothetical protein